MLNIIKFELKYRLVRPATYIYFAIMLLLSFLFTATDMVQASGGGGKVMDNSPVQITIIMMLMMWVGLLICSAVMGVPVIRDFEHKSSALIFTTPIKKWEYLAGRFLGSFIILLIIVSGILPGMMIGLSNSWFWQDTPPDLLPFDLWHYLHPFLVFVLPALFFFGSLFFAAGALGKKMTVVYAQAIIAFMGYLISIQLLGQLDNRNIAALTDPMGIAAYSVLTEYWTVTEQNTQVIPLEGLVLYNRLFWISVGVLALILTFARFSFSTVSADRKKRKQTSTTLHTDNIPAPKVHPQYSWKTNVLQVVNLSLFYFKWVVKQVPFMFIALAGIIFVFILGFTASTGGYDIGMYAT
ncbi:MAG: ABC transporter permease, partial [Cyclobacteriaceae bacterium]